MPTSLNVERFYQSFGTVLQVMNIQSPSHLVAFHSMLITDWQLLTNFSQEPGPMGELFLLVQYNCWTERWIGQVNFSTNAPPRQEVMRLNLDFWALVDGSNKESLVIGEDGLATKHFELFGSVEYWRDVYPFTDALGEFDVRGIAPVAGGGPPEPPIFTLENVEDSPLFHYTISLALLFGAS